MHVMVYAVWVVTIERAVPSKNRPNIDIPLIPELLQISVYYKRMRAITA